MKWNTSGQSTCKYRLQVSDKSNFSNILLDTGEQLVSNYVYSQGIFLESHSGWRCPADKDSTIQDVPIGHFISAEYLGSTCYDWFDGTPYCDYNWITEWQRCINLEEGCYFDEGGQCFCLSCIPRPQAATYIHNGYSSRGQTSFDYQTYLPRGKTYYYRVNVSNCGYYGGDTIVGGPSFVTWSGWANDSFYAPPLAVNNSPVVSNVQISPTGDTCSAGIDFASANLSWNYSDPDNDPQGSYRADGSWDTGRVYFGVNSYPLNNLSCGTTYSFHVRVWDIYGLVSPWSSYATYTTPPLNHPPAVYNLQVSQPGDYCSVGPHASFSWNYTDVDGDSENSWQIQVDDNSNFSSPVADSGRVYSAANSFSTTNLSYNTTYYWQVKVWDSRGVESDWTSGTPFAPPKHRYPTINFNWSPSKPSKNENALFTDQSTTYGGAGKAAWYWTFQNGAPGTSVQQNPTIQFTSEGNKQVSLTVTDNTQPTGYSCTGYNQINVNLPLPKWKEVNPR